ncbi:MAG: hypothetical protein AVDCRST_MAG14-1742 [uncultured Rubrobacteraceae bacterium]|uniref:ABC transmembrane type-2 domain-containing protein n=1 Tax=uncultured Rubrobacteraceae bacterium TaxID=349277 RepID=A0A6J4R208_9ACTN|nr:MAG: hypothetical protein AVDCRST_MAG14-1742 [uncultured Rubrobacteraceae bacterium]
MKIGAVAAKEFWGIVRQPQLLLLLLVGPVLIMVIFGLSLDVQSILQPRAIVVVEPESEGAELFEQYRYKFTDRTDFVGTTDDLDSAQQQLQRGEVDAVITMPSDPLESVARGEQAVMEVIYSTINPVFGTAVPRRSYGLLLSLNQSIVQEGITRNIGDVRSAQEQIDELNRQFENVDAAAEALASEEAQEETAELDESLAELEESLETLEDAPGETGDEASTTLEQVRETRELLEEVRAAQEAGAEEIKDQTGASELERTLADLQSSLAELPADASPQVLANPFRLEVENLAIPPGIVGFYTPGVLALLIQHIAVSLASLSVIRERLGGAYEFFEVSPLGAGELLAGKFLTYFGLVLGSNLAVAAVLTVFLGIPITGGVLTMALAMALVTGASLGIGFLVSALARSQLQAVQVSMLLLIASVLFAGFLFPLGDMKGPATGISYFLPAAYGIRSLQDIMLRGEGLSYFDLAGLLVIAAGCLALTRYLLGRKKT